MAGDGGQHRAPDGARGGALGPVKAYVASTLIDATVGGELSRATDATGKAIFGFMSGRSWDDGAGGGTSQASMQAGSMLAAGVLVASVTGAAFGKISQSENYTQKSASSSLQDNRLSLQLLAESAAGARAPNRISSYSLHAREQIAGRDGGIGVHQSAIDDAFENPINMRY